MGSMYIIGAVFIALGIILGVLFVKVKFLDNLAAGTIAIESIGIGLIIISIEGIIAEGAVALFLTFLGLLFVLFPFIGKITNKKNSANSETHDKTNKNLNEEIKNEKTASEKQTDDDFINDLIINKNKNCKEKNTAVNDSDFLNNETFDLKNYISKVKTVLKNKDDFVNFIIQETNFCYNNVEQDEHNIAYFVLYSVICPIIEKDDNEKLSLKQNVFLLLDFSIFIFFQSRLKVMTTHNREMIDYFSYTYEKLIINYSTKKFNIPFDLIDRLLDDRYKAYDKIMVSSTLENKSEGLFNQFRTFLRKDCFNEPFMKPLPIFNSIDSVIFETHLQNAYSLAVIETFSMVDTFIEEYNKKITDNSSAI